MNGKRKRFVVALKKFLEREKITVELFAENTGFSKDTVWAWLAGRRKPTKGTMQMLTKVISGK